MKKLLDLYFEKTKGYYPFFKYCPKKYRNYYLAKRAYNELGYEYDWQNPKTFNEKIRWLINNEKTDLKTKLTDKILVKSYVASKLGKHHSAELYGIYNNYEEIDFSVLPNEFVLKANHGWKMNVFIKNKDYVKVKEKELKNVTKKWLNTNYEDYSLEPQYKDIKRKLLIERYIPYSNLKGRMEPSVHCFNGEPVFIEQPVLINNIPHFQFFNKNWELQNFTYKTSFIDKPCIERPKEADEIIDSARKLAEGFSYVRIDFDFEGSDMRIIEMTFTPCSAFIPFKNRDVDLMLGEMLELQKEGIY